MYIVYYSVYCDYFVLIGCCVSKLLCPHRNVWPKIVYTRTLLFTENYLHAF